MSVYTASTEVGVFFFFKQGKTAKGRQEATPRQTGPCWGSAATPSWHVSVGCQRDDLKTYFKKEGTGASTGLTSACRKCFHSGSMSEGGKEHSSTTFSAFGLGSRRDVSPEAGRPSWHSAAGSEPARCSALKPFPSPLTVFKNVTCTLVAGTWE